MQIKIHCMQMRNLYLIWKLCKIGKNILYANFIYISYQQSIDH